MQLLYTADIADVSVVGFENKTNYFHSNNMPLDEGLAKGLWIFLNSTLVDQYFRKMNWHTQVNATDLRTLRYPTYE
ncbi:modification methylase, partial [Vibrio pomeroyi]